MDLYNLITKIPYLVMLGIGLVIILNIHIGGLQDISISLDDGDDIVDRAVIMDSMLNLQQGEIDAERGVIHVDYLTEESERDTGCYIPEVPRLDGDEYSYTVEIEGSGGNLINNHPCIVGTSTSSASQGTLQTSVIVVESNGDKHHGVLNII